MRNNVRVLGKGSKTLIFAHGYGCSQNMWRFVAADLKDDFKMILYDLTGSGNSDKHAYKNERYENLEGHAVDLQEILDELEVKNVNFVGHSVSATIGVLAAIKRPELFEKLFLVTPSPCFINSYDYNGGFSIDTLSGFLDTLKDDLKTWSLQVAPLMTDHQPVAEVELVTSIRQYEPEIANHFAKVTFFSDYRNKLNLLKTPTVIIQCLDDYFVPDEVGEFMNNIIEKSILEKLNATGHCPHITHPSEVIRILRKHL